MNPTALIWVRLEQSRTTLVVRLAETTAQPPRSLRRRAERRCSTARRARRNHHGRAPAVRSFLETNRDKDAPEALAQDECPNTINRCIWPIGLCLCLF
eukprot:469690-Pyramimonas_sp.AAC.1